MRTFKALWRLELAVLVAAGAFPMAASGAMATPLAGTASIGVPSQGTPPPLNVSRASGLAVSGSKRASGHVPAPALEPDYGTLQRSAAPSANPNHKAGLGGSVHFGPSHSGVGRLLVPPPSAAHPSTVRGFTPSTFYSSTQLDNFSAQCGFGVNETTIAQSTSNPNLLVAGANTYYNNTGECQDSHAGVYYSSDGGQHWHFEVMPGLVFPSSGDPGVVFDPVRQVFLFAFVEFNRTDGTKGRIGVEASSDGVNWSRNTTLDSNNSTYGVDKPSITVDHDPSSPHYGRVLVAWTEFFGNNAVYQTAYSDDGGASWTGGDASVNQESHECGNGTSPAFNASGEMMVAWADCTGGTNSIYEELSTDGGRTWSTGVDHQITTTSPLAGAEDPNAADCFLDHGGSSFRCNSFPSLAGDPNSSDAGGTAFVIVWADVRSTTQNSQTANVSQLIGLSSVDDGATWNGGSCCGFDFMAFDNFGDKFFPAASFAPDGRLTVSYSSREDDAGSTNPNGKRYDEHQTEAGSLTSLRADSFVTYTTDGTLGDPGGLEFIGDYSGNSSLDQNFDTFPIWTDLRNGFPSIRTQDLCYADCMTFLNPQAPLSVSRGSGTTFSDFYSFSMDPLTGSGGDFWNVVGLREGSDGTAVDDDAFLAPNRYYNSALAFSADSPPLNDYLLVNGNTGHAANTVYFPQVHSFSSSGGLYSIEWDPGQTVLGTSTAGGMGASNVARVYDTFLDTATTYFLGLRPNAGNTGNYSLTLHSASGGNQQGRPSAVADSGDVAPGSPAFVQYNTGADTSQYDGVVVVNNNGGNGTYTLYQDTAAPSGTIKIDGGATSTNNTTLNLKLSATNPTAGDPVADMAFSVNGGPFSAFRPYSTSTTVTVPAGEGTQTVAVEYRNGAGALSPPATGTIYLVRTPPAVSSVVPNAGSTAGGNTVTINGTHFAPGATVKFGTTASATVTFLSGTQLRAKVPAHASGVLDVSVTTVAGTSTKSSNDLYAYGRPTVSSFKPTSGITGSSVTITGTGFVPGATVKFGTLASSTVTFVSTTQLKAIVPNGAVAGKISVATAAGIGTSATNFVPTLSITSFSPLKGPTGTTVTIKGIGFNSGSKVKFKGVTASSVTHVSATQLKATVPPTATTGPITVTNTTKPAGTVSSKASYTVT